MNHSFAQEVIDKVKPLPIETMPEYPGGTNEMMIFIKKNIIYPSEAIKNKWEGKTFVTIVIDVTGKVTSPKVVKSSGHTILDEEMIRVLQLMQLWKPGTQNEKAVPVAITIPFNFLLKNK